MRVIIFSRFPYNANNPRGGVESATLGLINGLSLIDNLELHVVTLEKRLKCIKHENFKNTKIHRLPGSRFPMILDIFCGPGKRIVMKYIGELKPDVIHFQETYGLIKPKTKYPCVFTLHGFDSMNLVTERKWLWPVRSLIWGYVEKYGLGTQEQIVSINAYVTKKIKDHTTASIVDINNAIDDSYFSIKSQEVKGRIFFSGWINHRKNLFNVIKAVRILKERGVIVELHAAGEVGDEKYYKKVLSYIETHSLHASVKLMGRLDQTTIREELSRASVFVLPSYQENAPMAIAEAMAIGVPVITSNRCGMPYMIEQGKTGYLVEPDDIEIIARHIELIVTNQELRKNLSDMCIKNARLNYHPEAVGMRTYSVYKKLILQQKEI